MDNTMKIEPKAGVQAGLVNVSTDDINLTLQPSLILAPGEQSLAGKFLQKYRKAVRPLKEAQQEAEIKRIELVSISDAVVRYREMFPTFSDMQLFLLASGCYASPEQADNFISVFARAAEKVTVDKSDALPSSCFDLDVRGAQSAYEDNLRDVWGALIADEVSTGVERSKRAKRILEGMDGSDAKQLSNLLKFCIWTQTGLDRKISPIPVLTRTSADTTWSFNDGMISVESLELLQSLGLINLEKWIVFTIDPDDEIVFGTFTHSLIVRNQGTESIDIKLGSCRFLKAGVELAEIIEAPTDERVFGYLKNQFGLNIEWRRCPMLPLDKCSDSSGV